MTTTNEAAPPRTCFVICPIGEDGSAPRSRSDLVMRLIIRPAAEACGFKPDNIRRADDIPKPGIITSQVIEQLRNADLVVADLTDHNPNVFYELAVRHVVRKQLILLIERGQSIPFDVAPNRVIY